MKIRVLSLLLVLFLVGCAELPDLPPGSYGLFPRDGQDVTPGGTLVFQGWDIEVVAGLPTGVAVTHTPYPTYTQLPTYTPYPTYTPVGQAATPTPDSGITPSPTSPAVKVCLATTSAPINLRNDHSTNATIIDNIDPNTRMEVQHIWIVTDVTNEWFQVRALARSGVVRMGWVFRGTSVFLGVDDTEELCWDVPTSGPGSQDNTPVPTPTPPTATMTPLPTPTNVCMYRNAQNTMTIRQSYSTTSARVSSLPANVPAVVGHLFPNTATEAWAFINYGGITGWVAIRSGGTPYGTLEGDCSAIPRYQPSAALNTVVGIRTVPGAQGFEDMYPVLKAKGIPYGVSPYASLDYCINAIEQGGVCVFRPGAPDCPIGVSTSDPRANARSFMVHSAPYANVLKNYDNVHLEPINECMGTPISPENLIWWRDWMDEYITRAAELGWPPLALPGLPPGHGDEHMFRVWKDVLVKLDSHGGLFSMHSYTFNSRTGLCVCDEWEACRHLRNHQLMLDQGYSIPFTLTEAARWAGEAWVDVNDMVCFVNKVRSHGFVHSVWLWLGGAHPSWLLANLDGHYVEIAQRLSP